MFMANRRFLFHNYQNMNKIVEEDPEQGTGILWLGDYTAAMDKRLLKEKGVKTVLTTASGLGVSYLPSDGITHRQYHLLDIETQNISHCFDSTYKEIDEGLKRGGVLVHCAAGISRSATCLIAYLMRKNGTSFRDTVTMVRSKRRVVCPNFGFERQLKIFEQQLGISPHPGMKISSSANGPYNKNQNPNKQALQNLSNNLNSLNNVKSNLQDLSEGLLSNSPPALLINHNQKLNIQTQSQRNAIKRNQRLQPMSNRNMAEILAQKISQNNENLQILGIHKLINNQNNTANAVGKQPLQPEKDSNNSNNLYPGSNQNSGKKDGNPMSPFLQQHQQMNMTINNGPNIVTYNAKSNLRTSSRGPVPIQNNFQSNSNKTSNMVTSNNFRKRAVKVMYQ